MCNIALMIDSDLLKTKKEDKFQFERLGYFSADYDTNPETGRVVWNRTVTLKE